MGAKRTLFLIAPAVLVIGIFMLIPMFIAMGYSFMTANPYGGVNLPLTFDAYAQFLFQRDFDDTLVFAPDYIFIILRSIYLAVATTLICLMLGLPVAWYIVCQNESRRRILLFLITLPFWINTLIRTYCWILILRDEGLINDGLRAIGITSAPLPLLYNDGSILLGLVYTFLPFMVLPIYSTLERIDFRLIEAAYDRRLQTRGLASGQAGRARRCRARLRPGAGLVPGARSSGRRQEAPDRQPDPDAVQLLAQLALRCRAFDRHRHRRAAGLRTAGAPGAAAGEPRMNARASRPFDWRRTPGLPSFTGAILIFLYAPLLILVLYSFNASKLVTVWSGFSLRWFVQVANNDDIRSAALNSVIIAVAATIASTVIATAGALALERGTIRFGRGIVTGMIAMPLVVPEIVVAITTLVFFSLLGMHYGLLNLIIAHTVFCIPFALLPVQARLRDMGGTLEEAGRDLYADEWRLFRHVTLPLLAPAIAAGAIMAFVVSLDDFLISMMVSSAGSTTLPVYVYGMMRLGVTPEVNAISTILLVISLIFVATALLVGRRYRRAF